VDFISGHHKCNRDALLKADTRIRDGISGKMVEKPNRCLNLN